MSSHPKPRTPRSLVPVLIVVALIEAGAIVAAILVTLSRNPGAVDNLPKTGETHAVQHDR
jgi:hypothetical protein